MKYGLAKLNKNYFGGLNFKAKNTLNELKITVRLSLA